MQAQKQKMQKRHKLNIVKIQRKWLRSVTGQGKILWEKRSWGAVIAFGSLGGVGRGTPGGETDESGVTSWAVEELAIARLCRAPVTQLVMPVLPLYLCSTVTVRKAKCGGLSLEPCAVQLGLLTTQCRVLDEKSEIALKLCSLSSTRTAVGLFNVKGFCPAKCHFLWFFFFHW